MFVPWLRRLSVLFALLASCCSTLVAADVQKAIETLQKVEPGGKGTEVARKAVLEIAAAGETALIPTLKGFSATNRLGANWLRNAFDENIAKLKASDRKLPLAELEKFATDTKQSPIARRVAYETVKSADPAAEARLIPGMLLDPSSEFRRDAVAMLIAEATSQQDAAKASESYRKALTGAVHQDQVKTIAEALRKAGETVDIQKHFGFINSWKVAGPFDNKDEKGFAVAYAPENEAASPAGVNVQAEYDGQLGKVKWADIKTDDDFGVIDIAKQIQNYKGSLMYLSTTWNSQQAQDVEIRLGTPNAWKLWVNGEKVFEREEYHRNSEMDQYRIPVKLKAGANAIVLKLCQNEQTQEWAQDYQVQLRICDSTGAGILPVSQTASTSSSEGAVR